MPSAGIHAAVARAFAGHRALKGSRLQDMLAGRPIAIEQISGAIVDIAQAAEVPVPVLRDLVRLKDSAAPS